LLAFIEGAKPAEMVAAFEAFSRQAGGINEEGEEGWMRG